MNHNLLQAQRELKKYQKTDAIFGQTYVNVVLRFRDKNREPKKLAVIRCTKQLAHSFYNPKNEGSVLK